MAERTPKLQYETLTFENAGDGLEQTFTVPNDVGSLAFQVTAGTVVRRNVTGSSADGWTVANGLPQGFDMRSLEGEAMFFTGTEGAIMEICWVTGLLS
jgi:hypothetical protein